MTLPEDIDDIGLAGDGAGEDVNHNHNQKTIEQPTV